MAIILSAICTLHIAHVLYIQYQLYRLLITVLILPMFQSLNLSMGIGGDFIGLTIAVKSEEINFTDCQYYNSNKCIFDEHNNLTQSCIVMNYLELLGYTLVSRVINLIAKISLCKLSYVAPVYIVN